MWFKISISNSALKVLIQIFRKKKFFLNIFIEILRCCIYNVGTNEQFLFIIYLPYKGVFSLNKFSPFFTLPYRVWSSIVIVLLKIERRCSFSDKIKNFKKSFFYSIYIFRVVSPSSGVYRWKVLTTRNILSKKNFF